MTAIFFFALPPSLPGEWITNAPRYTADAAMLAYGNPSSGNDIL